MIAAGGRSETGSRLRWIGAGSGSDEEAEVLRDNEFKLFDLFVGLGGMEAGFESILSSSSE